MLGSIYLGLGQLDEAERAYQRARKLDDSADAYFRLGLVAAASGERKRKREALTFFTARPTI
jgi:cytochrome c-type biogenesis protein CcmH/NrfG